MPDRAGAARPGQRVGVRAADRRREERLRADPGRPRRRTSTSPPCAAAYDALTAQARDALAARGLRRGRARLRCAPPTCATSARPSRCACRCPTASSTAAALDGVAAAFHAEHRGLYGYDFAGDPRQQVEWVNLRVSGIGPITRPEIRRAARSPRQRPREAPLGRSPSRARSASTPTWVRRDAGPLAGRPRAPATSVDGPGRHRGVRLHGPAPPGLHRHRRRLRQPAGHGATDEPPRPDRVPLRPPDDGRRRGRRPGARRDRAGLARQRRGGGRDRDRAHQPQPDDPRRARLPRRHPRPAAAQAHRPVLLRARPSGRARLPDRGDARRATSSSTTTSTAPRAASGTCPTCASRSRCSHDGTWWSRSSRRSATTTTSAAPYPARCRARRPRSSRRA